MARRVVAGVLVVGGSSDLLGFDSLVSILVMCRWVRRVGVRVSTKLIQKQRGAGRFGRQTWSQKYAFDGQGACSTGEVVNCLVTTRPADTAVGYARK